METGRFNSPQFNCKSLIGLTCEKVFSTFKGLCLRSLEKLLVHEYKHIYTCTYILIPKVKLIKGKKSGRIF